ncbi:hypothetical protein F5Y16DRAFT_420706 [Xylariaceae sp. FL0255]|nr:hypothetical protein F5Y16DRAFT_420706 [Xylariaceae sp. FL0255]
MIPVIFIVGKPGSGKGAIGREIQAHYPVKHISLGDEFLSLLERRRQPVPGMPDEINYCLRMGVEIPEDYLAAAFHPVPAILLAHNADITGKDRDIALNVILQEKIAEIALSNEPRPTRAIVVDGLENLVIGPADKDIGAIVDHLTPLFCGITVLVDCSFHDARTRYLSQGHDGEEGSARFEARYDAWNRQMPRVLDYLGRRGVIVECVNGGSATLDQVFLSLAADLEEILLWRQLINGAPEALSFTREILDDDRHMEPE